MKREAPMSAREPVLADGHQAAATQALEEIVAATGLPLHDVPGAADSWTSALVPVWP
jgi:hypothetical protein